MTKIYLLLFLFIALSLTTLPVCAQSDTVMVKKLSGQILKQQEVLEKLNQELAIQRDSINSMTQRVKTLEKAINKWSNLLTFIGFPLAGGALIFSVYLHFYGIKQKAEKEVESAATSQLNLKAPEIVHRVMGQHPLIKEYDRIQQVKKKPILILSVKGKDIDFEDYLEKRGFANLESIPISEFRSVDKKAHKLIIFNNEEGDTTEDEMVAVTTHFGSGFHYFYFQGKGPLWTNKGVKMVGFASTRERLENNLIDALDR